MSSSSINPDQLDLVDPSLLPTQMRLLAQTVGLPVTIKLLQARGGTFFRFPLNARNSLLADIIGLAAAEKLSKQWGGKTWELPKTDKITIKIRNIAVRKARETKSASEVALMFDLTRRHVINISHTPALHVIDDLFD